MTARGAPWTLIVTFLAIIYCVPLSQAIIDVTLEEEERPLVLSLFEREETGSELPRGGWAGALVKRIKGILPPEKHLRDFEQQLEQSSYYEQRLRPVFQYARYVVLGELGEKATRGRGPWYFFTPGVRYLTEKPYSDLAQPGDPDPAAVIARFSEQLRARGIQLLVIPIPGKASIYPDQLVDGVAPGLELSAATAQLRADLRQREVQVFDLHQVFLDERERRERHRPGGKQEAPLYMQTDTHWTGDGAALTAAAVAGYIRRLPWFSGLPQQTRYTRRRVEVQRRGDVLRMTQIPRQEQLFTAETTTCAQVSLVSGGLYEDPEDPAEAPILVLGDSFSRVFQTDEPEAAGWIANLAFELQQPVSSIVNDGGASTLVRQELARTPDLLEGKRLVIWAFIERDIRFGMLGWQPIEL